MTHIYDICVLPKTAKNQSKIPKIKPLSGIRRRGVGMGCWVQGGPRELSYQDFQFQKVSLNQLDRRIPNVLFPLQSCLCTCHSKHIGGYLFCVSILHEKTEIIFLLSNAHIFILIWILFTITVQPVYVLVTLARHVMLTALISVQCKYCYM